MPNADAGTGDIPPGRSRWRYPVPPGDTVEKTNVNRHAKQSFASDLQTGTRRCCDRGRPCADCLWRRRW
ncbi:hypothetical protein CO2235_U840034 [Cupriavidus oxalaticus]|uniref:Uncharacterized protein n=1 Tax=Cupriavidus oxalaticus TaxID=96344 RepID=A0A375FQE1_9BURK|nr:hypothetical protein CO2235_U840034 [Cupriavidus oxalaticus]